MISPALVLQSISNRGVKVWPDGHAETWCVDQWRCRLVGKEEAPIDKHHIVDMLSRLDSANIDYVKTEHLYHFDGKRAYSLDQGA